MDNIAESYDPTKDLDASLNEKINIYIMPTFGRKCLTVITGLNLSKEQEKLFLSKAKEKFSTAAYKKIIPEFDNHNESYCCNGDKRVESKELIIKLFDKSDHVFYIHG